MNLKYNNLRLSQEVVNIITEKYNILDFIDLVDFMDPEKLSSALEKYNSHEFLHNERLVILHHDTDYYELINTTGYHVYNFFRLCANFDISLNHILFVTNHYGIKDEIRNVEKNICNSSDVKVIYTAQWYDFPGYEDIESAKKYHNMYTPQVLYSCLNGQIRMHRLLLLSLLNEKHLLEKGMISYHFRE